MKKQKGFFVVEAIVAIFVFVVGILGVLKVQTDSIAATSESYYRIQAAFFAENIVGQMTLDKNNIASYADGSSEEYKLWLEQLNKALPKSDLNLPEIKVQDVGTTKLVDVIIYWQKPLDSEVSKFKTQTTIF